MTTGEQADFWDRLEAKYVAPPGAVFIEEPRSMVWMAVVVGFGSVANAVLVALLLFANGEATSGWTSLVVVALYLAGVLFFLRTGRADLYIHFVLWPSLALNVLTHILLGGFMWSGGFLFFGINVSVIAAIFLGKRPGIILTAGYLAAAVAFAFLEPTLQAGRTQPAMVVSVALALDVFTWTLLALVPIVILLMRQITQERARAEGLLLNVLPATIADRLKRAPGVIADDVSECTVLFADLVGFTDHSRKVPAEQLIAELNHVFSRFDALADGCGAVKIKTMGDGYMVVAGAPTPRPDHAATICELALLMQEAMPGINRELSSDLRLRVGAHTGPLVAGVVGTTRFSYDLWGETVNLASRMETLSPPGGVQVTAEVAEAAGRRFVFERHETCEVKGVGPVETCLLVARA